MPEFILNGQAHGNVAGMLLANNFDVGALRPYVAEDNRTYISVRNSAGVLEPRLVSNAPTTLRKDDWIQLDTQLIKVAKERLKAVAYLRGRGLEYTIPNGMGKTVLQHEAQSDITPASVSMDGIREADRDRPQYSLTSLPLPIIHKDFSFTARQLEVSRSGQSPLDMTMAELAARRVAEEAEKLLIGTSTEFTSYAGATIYGMTTYPDRLTKTMTAPTGSNGPTTVTDVIAMREQLKAVHYYGPYVIFCSPSWDQYLDTDYSTTKGDNTLRDRIRAITDIQDVITLDYLPTKTMIMVQLTSEVIREVVGMDLTTVQWESHGGMMLNFKVMAIMVPQFRSDYLSQTGICHGTHA